MSIRATDKHSEKVIKCPASGTSLKGGWRVGEGVGIRHRGRIRGGWRRAREGVGICKGGRIRDDWRVLEEV